MDALRARWMRVDVQWDEIEPIQRSVRLRPGRPLVDAAQAAGTVRARRGAAHPRLGPTAQRERQPSTGERGRALQAYSTFCQRFAQRYTRPAARRIHAVEVWNEPNIPMSWSGGIRPDRYVGAAEEGVRRRQRGQPGHDRRDRRTRSGIGHPHDHEPPNVPAPHLRAGARNYFDAVGMHPYSYPYLPSQTGYNGWGNMINAPGDRPSMRATMEANGDAAKKIWVTEYGSPAAAVGEDGQAELAVDAVQHVGHLSVGRAVLLLLAPRRGHPDGRAPAQRRQPSSRSSCAARRHRRRHEPDDHDDDTETTTTTTTTHDDHRPPPSRPPPRPPGDGTGRPPLLRGGGSARRFRRWSRRRWRRRRGRRGTARPPARGPTRGRRRGGGRGRRRVPPTSPAASPTRRRPA